MNNIDNIKINIAENDIQIVDSYKVTSRNEMKTIISELKARYSDHPVFIKVSEKILVSEWCVHNLLYNLNILRSRTQSVDFNSDKTKLEIFLYRILSIFYIGL